MESQESNWDNFQKDPLSNLCHPDSQDSKEPPTEQIDMDSIGTTAPNSEEEQVISEPPQEQLDLEANSPTETLPSIVLEESPETPKNKGDSTMPNSQ